jgi:cell division protein ZapA
MGQVSVTLNNRTYRLACGAGDEARLATLVADVKARVDKLSGEFGQAADERILLMAAVLLADELMDVREAHEAMLQAAAEVLRETSQAANATGPAAVAKSEPAKAAATVGTAGDAKARADAQPLSGHPAQPHSGHPAQPHSGHPALPPQPAKSKSPA